ncbi:MAG: hypothetical protein JNJ54_29290 [Myxococcaceae bacterium]|nr:hypothetical protein [Myxococcaceae bacterium]
MLGLLLVSSLLVGGRLVTVAFGRQRPDVFLPLSLATGLLAFGWVVPVWGHAFGFSAATFWLLPAVLLLVGLADPHEVWRAVLSAVRRSRSYTLVEAAAVLAGAVAVVMVAAPTWTPENLNFDARWYHLGNAELYAAAGGIWRSPEGNHLLTGPHLWSWLATWAFLAPDSLYDRIVLASQIEVVAFVTTLALISALARALRPAGSSSRYSLAWVCFFLFPAIFIYDTGLMGGADRFAALWAASAFLLWTLARRTNRPGPWVLLGAHLAGAVLCKYTSVIFLAPFSVVVVVDRLLAWRRGNAFRPILVGQLGTVVAGAVTLAPYWVRNLVFYGNPVYPLAARLFGGGPYAPEAAVWQARYAVELFTPPDSSLWWRLGETVRAVADHHVGLYTWGDFTGGAPVFGSVFACLAIPALLTTRLSRVWLVIGMTAAGIALWFSLAHQMRYLVIFVPLMAAAVAVVVVELWSWGWLSRLAVVGLVALQLLGSLELPFFATHRMNGRRSPLAKLLEFLQRGQAERSAERFAVFRDWSVLGERLPVSARLLIHSYASSFGIGRVTLTDVPGIQLGLSYAHEGSVRGVFERLRAMGVTHVAWSDGSESPDSLASELLFRAYVDQLPRQFDQAGFHVSELAEPPQELDGPVLVLGCHGRYPAGGYPLAALGKPIPPPDAVVMPEAPALPWSAEAPWSAAIVAPGCPVQRSLHGFRPIGTNQGIQYFRRVP